MSQFDLSRLGVMQTPKLRRSGPDGAQPPPDGHDGQSAGGQVENAGFEVVDEEKK